MCCAQALHWLHASASVILFGPVGVGKTHIAQALGHLAIRQDAHLRLAKASRILAELEGGHADRTWEKRIRELVRLDVLRVAGKAIGILRCGPVRAIRKRVHAYSTHLGRHSKERQQFLSQGD
ncbi:ATP-binding protein [Streptomyces sp. NPDC057002]|uniref:ATP-binding protein n=1 Tax=Streptomyces sp. NPDC057002 TaxID=3345992 RepID=UPI00363CC912